MNLPLPRHDVTERALWAAIVVVLYIALSFVFNPQSAFLNARFDDPDDYMRMVQVHDFVNGQNWYDRTIKDLDPDHAFTQDWSRLPDVPLAALIHAARFIGFDLYSASYMAAYLWPLALLAALLWLYWRGQKLFLPADAFWLTLVLFVCNYFATRDFSPMRIDHHAYQQLCGLASFFLLIAALRCSQNDKAMLAGIVSSVAWAMGGEAWMPILLFLLGLSFLAVGNFPAAMVAGKKYAFGLMMGSIVLLPAIRPVHEWLTFSFALPSLHNILLASLACSVFSIALMAGQKHTKIFFISSGVFALWLITLLSPEAFNGIYGSLSPANTRLIIDQVTEAKPLYAFVQDYRPNLWQTILAAAKLGYSIAMPLVACLFAFYMAEKKKKAYWWFAALVLLVLLLLGCFWQIRALTHANVYALPLVAAFIWHLWRRKKKSPLTRKQFGYEVMMVLALGPLINPLLPGLVRGEPIIPHMLFHVSNKKLTDCTLNSVSDFLNNDPDFSSTPRRILSPLNMGPEILFRTRHQVFSAPYDVTMGNEFVYNLLSNRNMKHVKEQLQQQRVDALMLCMNAVPAVYAPQSVDDKKILTEVAEYLTTQKNIPREVVEKMRLIDRLIMGLPPEFLVPETRTQSHFIGLYHVR
ncbi:MAG: hypothetical protein EBQ89_03965 [Alphaproteobacteria bacterium]|nr:hypothetical protein [Alphaproteobacteria bacterium]